MGRYGPNRADGTPFIGPSPWRDGIACRLREARIALVLQDVLVKSPSNDADGADITLKGPSTAAPVLSMKYQPSAFRTAARPSENH